MAPTFSRASARLLAQHRPTTSYSSTYRPSNGNTNYTFRPLPSASAKYNKQPKHYNQNVRHFWPKNAGLMPHQLNHAHGFQNSNLTHRRFFAGASEPGGPPSHSGGSNEDTWSSLGSSEARSMWQGGNMQCEVLLIGGGIMSHSVAMFLSQLQPDWRIILLEQLGEVAQESTYCYNNAGTGHAALCELNYTPMDDEGHVDISKALDICEKFHVSRQWWAHLVESGAISDNTFINKTPHVSWCFGDTNVNFLQKRFDRLKREPLMNAMEYTEDFDKIGEWAPLLTEGRDRHEQKVAATRVEQGCDVNFGNVTRQISHALNIAPNGKVRLRNQVSTFENIKAPGGDYNWRVQVSNPKGEYHIDTKNVFIGAGGNSLPLLQATGIPEIEGYGGFPISGQFLVCRNQELVKKHNVKVYGKAAVGAPPMSVPHMDARYMDNERVLLFGPFAGFSPNFLKNGSYTDLLGSLNPFNLIPMAAAGAQNLDLTVYLAKELLATQEEHMKEVREFYRLAKAEDWEIHTAGQRVQIMKHHESKIGTIQMGTEVLVSKDRTMAGLMGASPGASVSVSIAIETLEKCFPEQMKSDEWNKKLRAMIPGYGQRLNDNPELCAQQMDRTAKILGMD